MTFATADLYDEHEEQLQVALPLFNNYGGKDKFYGEIVTIKCHEDNTFVRSLLEQDGSGKVMVVDGGESMRCALVGDNLAELGKKNNWQGIIVSGCIRDSAVIKNIDIGLKAMGTNPRKSIKKERGDLDMSVTFAGVTFTSGHYVYCDEDGIVVSAKALI